MSDFIFISDFDGTITDKDFYWILLDDYIGQKGIDFYHHWKKSKKIGTEFLNIIFGWQQMTNEDHDKALAKVTMDGSLETLVEFVEGHQGEFHILSAGFDYYIHHALKRQGLDHLHVLTNKGAFKEGRFVMTPDETSPYYSDVYGINKEAVALHYKTVGKKLYFAGDSEPDFWAAKHADVVFAKNELARIMDAHGLSYYAYSDFNDIYTRLKNLDIDSQLV